MKHAFFSACLLIASFQAAASPVSASKPADMQTGLDDLTVALVNHGYALLKVQPLDTALVKRGYEDPGVRLAFVGNDHHLRQALATHPALLNVLPLRLTLESTDGRLQVRSDDLAAWRQRVPPDAAELLRSWERELRLILSDYARQ